MITSLGHFYCCFQSSASVTMILQHIYLQVAKQQQCSPFLKMKLNLALKSHLLVHHKLINVTESDMKADKYTVFSLVPLLQISSLAQAKLQCLPTVLDWSVALQNIIQYHAC